MRRKFTDTLKSLPKEVRDRSPAQVGLNYCNKLFPLESDYVEQTLSFQDRHQARLKHSEPIAKKFFAWAKTEYEKTPVPKSMLGAVLTYAVRQEGWLMNVFWMDGHVSLRPSVFFRPSHVPRYLTLTNSKI